MASTEVDGMTPVTHEHRDVNGGWLRPAVFGAMDGVVSNFALIAGVAGSGAGPEIVTIAGLAGLAAGSFSMAAGEWVSVASEKEMVLNEIERERRELERNPEAEEAELAAVYVARGVTPEVAAEVARQLSQDPEHALEVHIREELGVAPDELSNPHVAAVSSLTCFAIGAIIPLLPYLLGAVTLWPAVILAMLGLFLCGALVSRVTTRSWWYSGSRQLVIGMAAAALTYTIGNLVGTAV